jgi:glutamate-1-semialdehyde 2,1-aminomutase
VLANPLHLRLTNEPGYYWNCQRFGETNPQDPSVNNSQSQYLYERALRVIPGGVNSPVRAFKAVGGQPLFMERGEGAYFIDADGNRYLDCIGSWGPLLFGHNHPKIQEALRKQIEKGTTYGAPTSLEVEMAETICRMVPSCENVRLVSSGTEATMSAIRAARGFTGRPKIIKFEGNYHGHADHLLAKSGSGVATLGLPDSAGVPASITSDTITLPFNDQSALETTFAENASEIACVILEPVAGNMGCIPPGEYYLQTLRDLTFKEGSVLIFDEVMTGFRVARGGAQEKFGIKPDLTTLGKIIGGGLPMAAYGGKREIMDCIAPVGPVYQAGTLSGNPLAVAAGLETLRMIEEDPGVYERLETRGKRVADGLREAASSNGVEATINQLGSMFTLFFTSGPVTDYVSAKTSNTSRFSRYFRGMLEQGIYLPPSQFEAAFLSDAMTDNDIEKLVGSSANVLRSIQNG